MDIDIYDDVSLYCSCSCSCRTGLCGLFPRGQWCTHWFILGLTCGQDALPSVVVGRLREVFGKSFDYWGNRSFTKVDTEYRFMLYFKEAVTVDKLRELLLYQFFCIDLISGERMPSGFLKAFDVVPFRCCYHYVNVDVPGWTLSIKAQSRNKDCCFGNVQFGDPRLYYKVTEILEDMFGDDPSSLFDRYKI